MRFPKHVSLARDIPLFMDAVPLIAGCHSALLPTASPPFVAYYPVWVFMEMPVPIGWFPGAVTEKHQLTSTVFHHDWTIAQKGHDCGPMIVHTGDLALFILHTINSSRKAMFEAGEVKLDGKPVACCTFTMDGMLAPMLVCGGPPGPNIGTSLMALNLNHVICGMHWIDVVAGFLRIAVELVISIGMMFLPGTKGSVGGNFVKIAASDVIGEILGPSVGDQTGNLADSCVALLHLAGQLFFGYHGDAELHGVSRDGATAATSAEWTPSITPPGVRSVPGPTIRVPDVANPSPVVTVPGLADLPTL